MQATRSQLEGASLIMRDLIAYITEQWESSGSDLLGLSLIPVKQLFRVPFCQPPSNHHQSRILSPRTYLFRIFHVSGIVQGVTFCVWLLALRGPFSRFIPVVADTSTSLLRTSETPRCGETAFCSPIRLPVDLWAVSALRLLGRCCYGHACTRICTGVPSFWGTPVSGAAHCDRSPGRLPSSKLASTRLRGWSSSFLFQKHCFPSWT